MIRHSGGLFSSASALRQGLQDCELTKNANHTPAINHILQELPQNCHKIFKENYHKCFPVFADDFSLLLKSKAFDRNKRYTDAISGYYTGDCKPDHHI